MRFDIYKALLPTEYCYVQDKKAGKVLREMLPIELETKVKNIAIKHVDFFTDDVCNIEEVEVSFSASTIEESETEKNIINSNSRLMVNNDGFISKETIGFSKSDKWFNYSCLEISTADDIILLNCATVNYEKTDNETFEVRRCNLGNFVYDRKSIEKSDSEELKELVLGNVQTTDIFDCVTRIKNELVVNKFIKPDYEVSIISSYDRQKNAFQAYINQDGEIDQTPLEIDISDIEKDDVKKIIKSFTSILEEQSIVSSFETVSKWEELGVEFNIFDNQKFLRNRVRLLTNNGYDSTKPEVGKVKWKK